MLTEHIEGGHVLWLGLPHVLCAQTLVTVLTVVTVTVLPGPRPQHPSW